MRRIPQRSTTVGIVADVENIPGLYIQKLLDVLSQNGYSLADFWPRSDLLRRFPLNTRFSELEFRFEEYLAFADDILGRFNIAGLGLRVGRLFRTSDFGILGYAQLSSPDLGFALKLSIQYQRLGGGCSNLTTRIHSEGNVVIWEEHSTLPPGRLRQFDLEAAMAQFMCARELLANPRDFKLLKVDFSFPEPDYLSLYEEIFGCPIRFDQPTTRIYFPRTLLDSKLGAENALAQEICEKQCVRFLRLIENRGGLTEKVRSIILNSPGTMPPLQDVSKEVNMSVRTVRRKLNSEGTTYKQILTDIRMKMAKQYLRETPLSIKEIGYLLCYSEVANFQRAFKKWYDKTPREMRLRFSDPH